MCHHADLKYLLYCSIKCFVSEVDGHIFCLLDLCSVHCILHTHLIKLWSQKMWKNMWVYHLYFYLGSVVLTDMILQGVLCSYFNYLSLFCYILGEMDDVLDNICTIHGCGSVYRYVSLLVSDFRYFMLINWIIYLLTVHIIYFHYALLYQWLHYFVSSLQDPFLLWTEDSLCGVAAVPLH